VDNSYDLIILGDTPAACLLALLVARSGQSVAVLGKPFKDDYLTVAQAPFDWFGESSPHWHESWLRSVFAGLALFEGQDTELCTFQMTQLNGSMTYQAMRSDAELWGAHFSSDVFQLGAESIQLGECNLKAQFIFDLRSGGNDFLDGYWVWTSEHVLSAPGVLEIYPQQGPLLIWSESSDCSYFALAGSLAAETQLDLFFPKSEDRALFSARPFFLPRTQQLAEIQFSKNSLSFPAVIGSLDPWSAVGQSLYLLWVRYAGYQIAEMGIQAPLLGHYLSLYWQKLLTVAQQKQTKYKFLR
jgi:hypothetical protein